MGVFPYWLTDEPITSGLPVIRPEPVPTTPAVTVTPRSGLSDQTLGPCCLGFGPRLRAPMLNCFITRRITFWLIPNSSSIWA